MDTIRPTICSYHNSIQGEVIEQVDKIDYRVRSLPIIESTYKAWNSQMAANDETDTQIRILRISQAFVMNIL